MTMLLNGSLLCKSVEQPACFHSSHQSVTPSSILIVALQALLVADFGPRTSLKIIDAIRKDILAGAIKSGEEIKVHGSLFLVCRKQILSSWMEPQASALMDLGGVLASPLSVAEWQISSGKDS
jgi:hypothetical protein